MARACLCGCGADLDALGKRPQAKYADHIHKARADRERNGQWVRSPGPTKPSRTVSRGQRRPNPPRIRPTLTRKEAMDLLQGRRTRDRDRARQKIADALIRSGRADG